MNALALLLLLLSCTANGLRLVSMNKSPPSSLKGAVTATRRQALNCLLPLSLVLCLTPQQPALAADSGATSMANAKIMTGGASTLQQGRTIAITRGVNLSNNDFSNQNLKGVAFQQVSE